MPKSTAPVPRPLALATERFEKWRKRGRARRKIPARLWDLARSLAETYGVNRTAQALRLDYYDLKGRVEAEFGLLADANHSRHRTCGIVNPAGDRLLRHPRHAATDQSRPVPQAARR